MIATLEDTKHKFEVAKAKVEKPFAKAQELKDKVLRLSEINKQLDIGDVEEKDNINPLME